MKPTPFYESIPVEIREKLQEYINLYSYSNIYGDGIDMPLSTCERLSVCFLFGETPEGNKFWQKHHENKTLPTWSESEQRFINP